MPQKLKMKYSENYKQNATKIENYLQMSFFFSNFALDFKIYSLWITYIVLQMTYCRTV